MTGQSCKTCRFFVRDRLHPKNGACRAHPPIVATLQTPQGVMSTGQFPPVTEDIWCGEYQLKVSVPDRMAMTIEGRAQ